MYLKKTALVMYLLVLASSAVNCGLEPRGICSFSTERVAQGRKSKDGLALNQDHRSE